MHLRHAQKSLNNLGNDTEQFYVISVRVLPRNCLAERLQGRHVPSAKNTTKQTKWSWVCSNNWQKAVCSKGMWEKGFYFPCLTPKRPAQRPNNKQIPFCCPVRHKSVTVVQQKGLFYTFPTSKTYKSLKEPADFATNGEDNPEKCPPSAIRRRDWCCRHLQDSHSCTRRTPVMKCWKKQHQKISHVVDFLIILMSGVTHSE